MSQFASQPDPLTNQAIAHRTGCSRWFFCDGTLRSGWRVFLYLIVIGLVNLGISFAIGLALALIIGIAQTRAGIPPAETTRQISAVLTNPLDYPLPTFALMALRVIITVGVVWLFRRFIDHRSLLSLGLQFSRGWWQECVLGFVFSLAAWAGIFALSLTLGTATVTGYEWQARDLIALAGALGFGIVFNLLVGISEEVDARGYVLQNLMQGIHLGPAILVSSLYFGLLHLLNPGAGLGSTLGIFFAGIVLALGYYATGRLWFSIGMHAGWNWAEGPLFGFLVSGLNMGGLFRLKITGPDWLMGGAFGPEAGVVSILLEIVMIVVLLVWGRARRSTACQARI